MLDTTENATLMRPTGISDPCYCNSPRTGWIVATTHPQAEPWAETNLQHRGYRTYLPRHAVRRRDRTIPTLSRVVLAPLWSGYIFVHHDTRDSWRPIYETPGVRSVLRNRDQIQFAPEAAVEALRASEHLRATPTPPRALWAPGMACKLAAGPFAQHDAVITEVGADMALVALLMFGHLREVAVPPKFLEPRDT